MKTAKHYFMHLSILLAVFLFMQAPFAVFADMIDDNESGRVEVVEEGDKYLVTGDVKFRAVWEKAE